MAVNVGDIIQFTDQQTLLNQQVLNVYDYRVVSADPDVTLEMISQGFELQVVNVVRELQCVALNHTTIVTKNLTNGVDIWEEPVNALGIIATDQPLASFYACGFRLVRSSALTRHGGKRIGGIAEEQVVGNSLTAPGLAIANMVAVAMGAEVSAEGTIADYVLEPVIVGRIETGLPGAGGYDLSKINPVSSAQFIRVTTQTTRRAGRGS